MLSEDELTHTATLERFEGETIAGASYAAAEPLPCYPEPDVRLLEQTYGVESGVEGLLFANDDTIPVGSRITLRGRTTYVASVQPYDDGSELSHAEIALSGRPPAAALRTATVALRRRPGDGKPVFNTSTKTSTRTAPTYAEDVAASIRPDADALERRSADDLVSSAPYVVGLHTSLNPLEGDLVHVTACDEDITLVGRDLRVLSTLRGTQRHERQLRCELVSDL